MSIISFSGSILPVQNTVHMVGTFPTSGNYIAKWDLGPMQNGDEIELRIADKVGAGTISCVYSVGYAHYQATQLKASPPWPTPLPGGHVSIVQRAGTSRWFWFQIESA